MAEPGHPWERAGFFRRLADKATPSREEVLESRWLKPFGKRIRQSDLWRFTRRSVPRGVPAACSSASS
jgi:hypothetical protein